LIADQVNPGENAMTLNTSTKILSFSAVAAAAAVLFSLSAHAGPNSAGPRCQGMSKEKVIKCCEQMIVNSSYRKIMGTSGRCEGAVVCKRVRFASLDTTHLSGATGGRGRYLCYLKKPNRRFSPNDRFAPDAKPKEYPSTGIMNPRSGNTNPGGGSPNTGGGQDNNPDTPF
jgi:hypothetical protein